jgi:hypothetical protein
MQIDYTYFPYSFQQACIGPMSLELVLIILWYEYINTVDITP